MEGMRPIRRIVDAVKGKAPKGAKRSSKWRKVRKLFLVDHPRCIVCGGKKKLEVHHIVPFHVNMLLELDPKNLATLCERKKYGLNCHLLVGHRGNYRRHNEVFERTVTMARALLSKEN